jgi:hypothetical protein
LDPQQWKFENKNNYLLFFILFDWNAKFNSNPQLKNNIRGQNIWKSPLIHRQIKYVSNYRRIFWFVSVCCWKMPFRNDKLFPPINQQKQIYFSNWTPWHLLALVGDFLSTIKISKSPKMKNNNIKYANLLYHWSPEGKKIREANPISYFILPNYFEKIKHKTIFVQRKKNGKWAKKRKQKDYRNQLSHQQI